MVFCSTIAIAMYWAGKIEPIKMSAREYFATVFPVGFLYSMSLVCATSAYMLLSVSFVQMLKACMPVATFTMGCLFGTEVFSWPTLANMGVITLGVAIASYGEINAVFLGVVLQFGYIVTESLRLTLIQILLKSKGKSMNPFQTLLYVAPSCAACLLFPFFMWEAGEAHIPPSLILPLLANCCVAFGLNIAVYMLIGACRPREGDDRKRLTGFCKTRRVLQRAHPEHLRHRQGLRRHRPLVRHLRRAGDRALHLRVQRERLRHLLPEPGQGEGERGEGAGDVRVQGGGRGVRRPAEERGPGGPVGPDLRPAESDEDSV